MSVIVNPLDSRMVLEFQTGTDTDGNPVLKKKSFARIKAEISNEDFYQLAAVLSGLQAHTVNEIFRDDLMTVEQE